MSKGQRRSNREIKKPKQEKPKAAPAGTAFSAVVAKQSPLSRGKKSS